MKEENRYTAPDDDRKVFRRTGGYLDLLEAAVEGSYGNSYFVSGVYDTETEEIVEIQCECPRLLGV